MATRSDQGGTTNQERGTTAGQTAGNAGAGATVTGPTAGSTTSGTQTNAGAGTQTGQTAGGERTQQLRDKAQNVGRDLQEMGTAARDAAGEYYEVGRQRASELQHTLEDRIREKPLNSVLIAAGIGMVVGMIFLRR